MEILVIAVLVIVFLLVLGVSVESIIHGILILLWIFAVLCFAIFAIVGIVLLFTKSKEATLIRFEKSEIYGLRVFYLIDGKEYKNTFPADDFSKKLIERKRKVKVRGIFGRKRYLIFDKISILVIILGLVCFALLAFSLRFSVL